MAVKSDILQPPCASAVLITLQAKDLMISRDYCNVTDTLETQLNLIIFKQVNDFLASALRRLIDALVNFVLQIDSVTEKRQYNIQLLAGYCLQPIS